MLCEKRSDEDYIDWLEGFVYTVSYDDYYDYDSFEEIEENRTAYEENKPITIEEYNLVYLDK